MKFGADNQFEHLRKVLLTKPIHYDIREPINPWQEEWVNNIDNGLALQQHRKMSDALENEGVDVYYLEPIEGDTEQKDSRDIGIIGSSGAIVATQRHEIKERERGVFTGFCEKHDIPVLNKDTEIMFEGGDYFSINKSTALLGLGARTLESAQKIGELVDKPNLELIHHKSAHHLDAVFNVLSRELIVCHESSVDIGEVNWLENKEIISLAHKDVENMAANYLLLKENKVLADEGCHEFNRKLEHEGVDVIETNVSELKKNGGSIRCMTLPMWRR